MLLTPQVKTFVLGLSVSILVLASFFAGAIADRLFVIQPLDILTGRSRLPLVSSNLSSDEAGGSRLGTLVAEGASVADVAEVASESVVTVSVKRQERVFDPDENVFNFGFGFFGIPRGRVEEVQRDIGTGFVADDDGLIVTNKHVVGDATAEYLVIDRNNQEYVVSKIYRDPVSDLAILKADNFSIRALPLGDSGQLRVGESVIAIGTALGEFRHTVTTGVISGLGRGIQAIDPGAKVAEDLEGVIQTDAAINPGNSGGPLLDRSGKVIGVNVAVSAGAENIGFALPINIIKASIDNFKSTGEFDRPALGVTYRNIDQEAALFNKVPQGSYVLGVTPGYPAERAGLKEGDILTEFDGQSLAEHNLATLTNQKKVNDMVTLKYWRDGQEQSAQLTLNVTQ